MLFPRNFPLIESSWGNFWEFLEISEKSGNLLGVKKFLGKLLLGENGKVPLFGNWNRKVLVFAGTFPKIREFSSFFFFPVVVKKIAERNRAAAQYRLGGQGSDSS